MPAMVELLYVHVPKYLLGYQPWKLRARSVLAEDQLGDGNERAVAAPLHKIKNLPYWRE